MLLGQSLEELIREFKLEVQQNIVCRFAAEGRDVYSLTVVSFTPKLRRSAIAFAASAKVLLPGFAPLERKGMQLLHCKLNSRFDGSSHRL